MMLHVGYKRGGRGGGDARAPKAREICGSSWDDLHLIVSGFGHLFDKFSRKGVT